MSDTNLTRIPDPNPFISLMGRTFGNLEVISRVAFKRYVCSCTDCGGLSIIPWGRLVSGDTTSCGCLQPEKLKPITSEFRAWLNMWQRCTNPKNPSFRLYSSRTPPEEWRDFEVFLAHIGPKPSPKLSLDRIDNDKPYGPGNVRWATSSEQCNNTSRNRKITYEGKTLTMAQWERELGMNTSTLRPLLVKHGWSMEKALTTPVTP